MQVLWAGNIHTNGDPLREEMAIQKPSTQLQWQRSLPTVLVRQEQGSPEPSDLLRWRLHIIQPRCHPEAGDASHLYVPGKHFTLILHNTAQFAPVMMQPLTLPHLSHLVKFNLTHLTQMQRPTAMEKSTHANIISCPANLAALLSSDQVMVSSLTLQSPECVANFSHYQATSYW